LIDEIGTNLMRRDEKEDESKKRMEEQIGDQKEEMMA
jgi:hypothetical protein